MTHRGHFLARAALALALAYGSALLAVADDPLAPVKLRLMEVALPDHDCISDDERRVVAAALHDYRSRGGWHPAPETGTPQRYRFVPQAGNVWQDLIVNNYVDLDPSGAIVAFECTDWSYNGHLGHDIDIRDFGHQDVGVPVFAAQDGTVFYAADGNPDRNTSCSGLANAVAIDHGGGRVAYYWHLRNGSVAVTNGQVVVAGQQIGMTASSGCSTAPHLHFETADDGATYEPYAGGCRAGASGWESQPPVVTTTYFNDFGISTVNPNSTPWPNPGPRNAQLAFTDPSFYYWVTGHYLPVGSTLRVRFMRPNGTQEYDSGTLNFNNGVRYRHVVFNQGPWNFPAMRTIAGVWHVEISINGVVQVTAPITVVPTRDPAFNRPPEPITVALDPAAPTADDVIFCRVSGSLTLDDLDWDIVRYRYEWRADGALIRDVETAARSDAIRRNAAAAGDVLTCTVTASDGRGGTGAAVMASVTLSGGVTLGDANCDESVDFFDIDPFLLALFDLTAYQQVYCGGSVASVDVDCSNGVDFFDIDPFLACLFGACAACP